MAKVRKRQMINEALRLSRLYWGYSQAELAQHLGVGQSIVSEIENGRKSVTIDLLERYSQALNVKMSSLMFFAENIDGMSRTTRGNSIVAIRVLELLNEIAPKDVG